MNLLLWYQVQLRLKKFRVWSSFFTKTIKEKGKRLLRFELTRSMESPQLLLRMSVERKFNIFQQFWYVKFVIIHLALKSNKKILQLLNFYAVQEIFFTCTFFLVKTGWRQNVNVTLNQKNTYLETIKMKFVMFSTCYKRGSLWKKI